MHNRSTAHRYPCNRNWVLSICIGAIGFPFFFLCITATTWPDELTRHKIRVGKVERTYYVRTGKVKTKGLPLVVVLHGGGGNGRGLRNTYGFKPLVENRECVAVYPSALKGGWLPNDVAFLDAVIDEVFQREEADRKRLFITGASRGGLMTFIMAAKSKHKIKAAGTVIASQMKALADEFPISRPIDFAMIAGTKDPLMPYDGGWGAMRKPKKTGDPKARILSVQESIKLLLKANKMTGEPVVFSLGNKNKEDGCTNEVRFWRNAKTKRRVMLVTVKGGGHVVPGGRQYLPKSLIGPVCKDFNHAQVMWEFFTARKQMAVESRPKEVNALSEKALRVRVQKLFEATRVGEIADCIQLSDPATVKKHGRRKAEKFFQAIHALVKLAKVGKDDHRINSVSIVNDGKSARVQTQLRLNRRWRPPGTQVWVLVEGEWYYQQTLKQ